LVTTSLAVMASAFSSSGRSPWAASEWCIQVNIGREAGTWMPEEWAASGSRLPFNVEISVESGYATQKDQESEFMGSNALRLCVVEDPTYVTSQGMQYVEIPDEGGWKLQLPKQKGNAGTLRLWLDFEQSPELDEGLAAVRNDVTLAVGRLYFMAPCWREPDLAIGYRKIKPIEAAAQTAQQRLDSQLSHESGDRRLDGTNPIDTALASIDMAGLVKERDDRVRDLREAERKLPRNPRELPVGFWPGTMDKLAIAPGSIAVKRKKMFGEEFHIVGKWTAVPIADTVVVESEV
jgi:hypothetical protein